jgi:N-acetylmuramoyl-L-alanine amidase
VRRQVAVGFSTSYDTYLTGVVRSGLDSSVLPGAQVIQSDLAFHQAAILDTTWSDGRFIAYRRLPDPLVLQIQHTGYFASRQQYRHATEPIQADDVLEPVAGGRLFGKTYLIDPRYGGTETGGMSTSGLRDADANLEVAHRVYDLLQAAGADAVMIRDKDTTIAETERSRLSALHPRGMYIRIDASGKDGQVSAAIYQSLVNNAFAARVLGGISRTAGLDSAGISGSQDRFFYDVAMGTISLIIPSATTGRYEGVRNRRFDEIAWGIFLGILHSEGFGPEVSAGYEVRSGIDEAPLAGVIVLVNETLAAVTDERGRVSFYGIEPVDATLRVPGNDNAVIRRVAP